MKIIHLERNFIRATETFIANQVNALSVDTENFVFTAQRDDHLQTKADIRAPDPKAFGTKWLRSSHKKFFVEQATVISPDVIHAHFITDACMFHPFTKHLSVPKVCSCYGWDVTEVPLRFKYVYKYFYNKVIAEYDCFLAMSDDMKADLMKIGVPEDKIKVHYHGINTANFKLARTYELKENTLNLLTIASFREKKGHLTVLKALHQLSQNRPDIKFNYDIVGSGNREKVLREFIDTHGLKEKVIFHGLIKHGEELNRLIALADVFVHPSETTATNDKEGIPGAVVEAMASGLPVISTFHAGIPEVIKNGLNGILIAERDTHALTDNLIELYDHGDKRKRLGKAAAEYAMNHLDYMTKAENLKKLYKTLLEKADNE